MQPLVHLPPFDFWEIACSLPIQTGRGGTPVTEPHNRRVRALSRLLIPEHAGQRAGEGHLPTLDDRGVLRRQQEARRPGRALPPAITIDLAGVHCRGPGRGPRAGICAADRPLVGGGTARKWPGACRSRLGLAKPGQAGGVTRRAGRVPATGARQNGQPQRHGPGRRRGQAGPAGFAPPAACATLGYTGKTPVRPVSLRIRRTCCGGAARDSSPPLARIHFRTRTSTPSPQQSMNARPAMSTMTSGPQAATIAIRCDSTAGTSARSNSPRKATTA